MNRTSVSLATIAAAALFSPAAAQTTAPAAEQPGFEPFAATRADLVERIDQYFNDERFDDAFWGALIIDPATDEVWYERNADKLFMPASNQKIPTSAAALKTLGPDWRFTTTFSTNGEIDDGDLEGDLVVFGNGDPTLYDGPDDRRAFFDDTRTVFRQVAQKLKDLGIERIDGDIIAVDDAFSDNHINTGWAVSNTYYWYGAPYGPLQINEGYVDVEVVPPATADGEVELIPNVPSEYFTFINEIEVLPPDPNGRNSVSFSRPFHENVFTFTGRVYAGTDSFERSPSIVDPTGFYVTVLTETLQEEGIEVEGGAIDADDIEGWDTDFDTLTVLHEHESAPLSEILTLLMKRSQNNYAETVLHLLGYLESGTGTPNSGERAIKNALSEWVEPDSFIMGDGSGLSRYNMISPRIIASIYKGMREGPHADLWYSMQPSAGTGDVVTGGTLTRRMADTPAEGNVHAKTGTISNVRGLSGYVTTADGRELVFSFLVNNHNSSSRATEEVTDPALELIARFIEESP